MSLDLEDDYIIYNKKNNELEYNELKELNEEFKFSIIYETYTNGLSIKDAYIKAGFDVSVSQRYQYEAEDFISKATSLNFKDTLKEYCNLIDKRPSDTEKINEHRILHLEKIDPSIIDIVKNLGTSKCKTLKYTKKAINEYYYSSSKEVNNVIKNKIVEMFEKGVIYTAKEVKEKLQTIYDDLKLNKKAKATDVSEFCKIDKKKRYVDKTTTDTIIFE